MTALLAGHLVLHLYLVAHLFDLASTGVLLGQKTIDKIRHLDLKLILHVVLHATNDTSELVVIFEIRHLKTAHVFLVSALFSIDKLQSLLKAHYLGLDTFKDFIQEHRSGITLAINQLVVLLLLTQSGLEVGDTCLKLLVEPSKSLAVLFCLLADPNHLVEQD